MRDTSLKTTESPNRAVILVAIATSFSLLGDQTLYAVLPTYFTHLGMVPYQVGLILSLNRWIRLLTNQLAERLCRVYSPANLLGASLFLGAAITFLYGWVTTFLVLLCGRLLWGLCWSFIRQIGMLTVMSSTAEGRMGLMMGYYNGISRIGALAGNFVGALLHDLIGYRLTLTLFGCISLAAAPLGVLSTSRLPLSPKKLQERDLVSWRDPGLWLLGFVVGCVGTGLVVSTLGWVLKESVGESLVVVGVLVGIATVNGALLAFRWAADGLAAPLLGAFSDRIGRRWAALLFFCVGALALSEGGLVSETTLLIVMVLLFFVCGVGATVVMFSEVGTRGPRAVATYVTAYDLGSAAGPLLGWMTQQIYLPTETILFMGAGLYALAALLALRYL